MHSVSARNTRHTDGASAWRRVAGGSRAIALALVALAMLPLSAYAGDASAPEPPRIEVIRFPGASGLSAGHLRHVMRLHAGVWWKPFEKNYFFGTDHLEPDLERIIEEYHAEGFFFARIEEAVVRYVSRDRVAIEIQVNEGPRVRVSDWELAAPSGALTEKLREAITIQAGEPLREPRVSADELKLTEICAEAGYALAQVTHEYVFAGDSAKVVYRVDLGRPVLMGETRVTGLTRTRESVVQREMMLKKGDLFRRSRAVQSRDRLFDLGLFRTVRITPSFSDSGAADAAARVDLDVSVTEKAPGWYGGGFGASSRDQFRFVGEWGYRNLAGRALGVQLSALAGWSLQEWEERRIDDPTEWQVETILAEPWLFGSGVRGQVSGSYRFNREPTFEERIVSLEFLAHRDFSRTRTLSGSIRKKWVHTNDPLADRSGFDIPSLSLALSEDTRDFVLDPQRGYLIQAGADQDGGPLGGPVCFWRGALGGAFYMPLGGGVRCAYRMRAGVIQPWGDATKGVARDSLLLTIPFDERFRAGGGTSVRGYQTDRLGPFSDLGQPLGGLFLALVNVELRFPIVGPFEGAAFLDAGNVWSHWQNVTPGALLGGLTRDHFEERDVAYGAGCGLRFVTPVGPLRLDIGWKLNRARRPDTNGAELHFSLGQAF